MGRRLEFDKDKALFQAMESFWAKGYDATSMRDLASRLGLHLGSVYNALGGKEEVFEQALRLHFETHVLPNLEKLKAAPHPMRALNDYMDRVSLECGGLESTPGCFLTNSLLEITSINERITATLHRYLAQMEEGFALCIRRAREEGHLPPVTDEQRAAKFIISTLFSLRVMGKLGMPFLYIQSIKDSALKALRCLNQA